MKFLKKIMEVQFHHHLVTLLVLQIDPTEIIYSVTRKFLKLHMCLPRNQKSYKICNKWKVGNLIKPDQCLLHEKTILLDTILEFNTPLQFISYFFNDSLIEIILNETQLYSLQQDVNKPKNISKTELNRY